jgi:hypothetical protein
MVIRYSTIFPPPVNIYEDAIAGVTVSGSQLALKSLSTINDAAPVTDAPVIEAEKEIVTPAEASQSANILFL